MNRLRVSAVGIIVMAGLVPTGTYAAFLHGGGATGAREVTTGIWIAKAVLLLHALFLLAGSRIRLAGAGHLLPPRLREETTRRELWILGGILAAGIAIRLHQLGTGLWYDEIETLVRYARLPVGQIVTTFDSQNQHLFYSVLSSISIGLFGETGWALRLPAAIFGVLSLWAVWWFARRVTGNREALMGVALLTFSYHHVWFSQNARGYTALLFWTLMGTGFFLDLLRNERPAWSTPVLYAGCMALAIYTHVTAVVVVFSHVTVLAVLWWRRREAAERSALAPVCGVVLATTFTLQLYALVLPQFMDTLLAPSPHAVETAWKDPFWLALETMRGLAASVPGGWVALAGAVVVGIAGLVSYGQQGFSVAALMVIPGALTGLLIVGLGHNLWPRFFFFSAGFAALIAVRGIFALARAVRIPRSTSWATAVCALVALGSATTVPRAWQPKQDYLAAARFVQDSARGNDAVVVVDLTRYPYRQYLGKPWEEVEDVAGLLDIERRHGRTWVLYTFPIRLEAAHPDIWSHLQATFTTQAVFPGTVGGGAIVVMVSGRPSETAKRPG